MRSLLRRLNGPEPDLVNSVDGDYVRVTFRFAGDGGSNDD